MKERTRERENGIKGEEQKDRDGMGERNQRRE
jgi:hypothetical protein